ncbi:GGDEF domain-containing response regulator [Tautonia sociabilis]|uniref:diguanylate cyclase n=1 Tax=Tautonia sociabilis TaxID=2080755 RepID=A0A432MCY8_9BACT|nr:diguanylate cyclase [Tautonia sociabilis]RUL82319.1 diguanylate cyclase [Tautonia sociabilis]
MVRSEGCWIRKGSTTSSQGSWIRGKIKGLLEILQGSGLFCEIVQQFIGSEAFADEMRFMLESGSMDRMLDIFLGLDGIDTLLEGFWTSPSAIGLVNLLLSGPPSIRGRLSTAKAATRGNHFRGGPRPDAGPMPRRVLILAARPASMARAAIGDYLQAEQVRVGQADPTDWRDGLAKAPDLILLEHRPPAIDGLGFLPEVLATTEPAGIPVLVFSGPDHAAEASTALGLGASDVLPPNPSAAEFWPRVSAAIRLRDRLRDLVDQSSMDGLTRLSNRLAFEARLRKEWAGLFPNASPLSLLMIDIDRFKRINDSKGHLLGDEVLRMRNPERSIRRRG